jgi:hypothetical protein
VQFFQKLGGCCTTSSTGSIKNTQAHQVHLCQRTQRHCECKQQNNRVPHYSQTEFRIGNTYEKHIQKIKSLFRVLGATKQLVAFFIYASHPQKSKINAYPFELKTHNPFYQGNKTFYHSVYITTPARAKPGPVLLL